MSLFQEYKKLKAANQLITSGSIWKDNCGDVKIREVNKNKVEYIPLPQRYDGTHFYPKSSFLIHFTRIS